jgi:uncharacterized protein YhdP
MNGFRPVPRRGLRNHCIIGADYVFQPDYRLSPLTEVATYIEQNHHLPGIPSAKEVQTQGVNLGAMQTKLLAKIEELTLHMIQADERNNRLEAQGRDLREQNRDLQQRIARLEAAQATSGTDHSVGSGNPESH